MRLMQGGSTMKTTRSEMTRRSMLLSAGGALSAPVLVACGAGPQSAKPTTATGELVFMDWGDIANTPTEVVVKNFQEKFPNIKLQVDPTPADYETKMRALVAAGTPDDVHRVNDDYVRSYAAGKLLIDLFPYIRRDKLKREDFFPTVYDFPIFENKYWAWGVGNNPRLLFVNLTLFNNMGVKAPVFDTWDPPGWTWEDMIDAAKKLTKDFGTDAAQFGVSIYDDTGFEETFLQTFGVADGIYSKETNPQKWTMASPEGIGALQQVIDLTCVQRVQRPYDFRQSSSTLFQQGKLGMQFNTVGYANTLARNVKDFDWDIAPVPKKVKRVTEGSLIAYCVPKDAQHPDAAWQFLNYMGGEEAGQVFAEQRAFIPTRLAAAQTYFKAKPGEKPA